MIKTETKGNITYIETDQACLVHTPSGRRGERRTYLLPGETVDEYQEVAEKPPFTEAEYKAKVAELIHERYSADEETSLINNMLDENPTEEHLAEYRAYQAFRAKCKQRAKDPQLYKKDPDEIES